MHRKISAHLEKECLNALQFRMVGPMRVNDLLEKGGKPDHFLPAEDVVCFNNMLD
jgi:hypothetical protein